MKCGADKYGSWTVCNDCGRTPHGEWELAASLILSDHYLTPEDFVGVKQHFHKFDRPPKIEDAWVNEVLETINKSRRSLQRRGLLD